MASDTIYYLTNDVTDSSTVYNYETDKYSDIYDMEKRDSNDPYEMFLSGAAPLLMIEELILSASYLHNILRCLLRL
jgi:hypothetical protein